MESFIQDIDNLLEQYVGGTLFFDELDNKIRCNPEIMQMLLDVVDTEFPDAKIITTGSFGIALNYIFPDRVHIHLDGGIRKDTSKVSILHSITDKIKDQSFVILDDSFFSGRTAFTIGNEIERLGGTVLKIIVAYDGCKFKYYNVQSLYRYYDNHPITPDNITESMCKKCYHQDVCMVSLLNAHPTDCTKYKEEDLIIELPCKFDDKIYQVTPVYDDDMNICDYFINHRMFHAGLVRLIGMSYFYTNQIDAEIKMQELKNELNIESRE